MDDPSLPADVGVMSTEPRITKDERLTRGVQDVKLDQLMVVNGQEHGNLCGLVRDSSQDMAVESLSGNLT